MIWAIKRVADAGRRTPRSCVGSPRPSYYAWFRVRLAWARSDYAEGLQGTYIVDVLALAGIRPEQCNSEFVIA